MKDEASVDQNIEDSNSEAEMEQLFQEEAEKKYEKK